MSDSLLYISSIGMSRECREGIRVVVIACGGVYFYAHARSKFLGRELLNTHQMIRRYATTWIEELGGC